MSTVNYKSVTLNSITLRLAYNGPAVCFSRRKPTTAPGKILVPRVSGAKNLSLCKEAMAHFLPSGYKFCELYECRGTMLIGSRLLVKTYEVLLRTLALSRYKLLLIRLGCRSKSKKCDKPINYTVRVRTCYFFFIPLISFNRSAVFSI
jgi:hypothetical protein